MPALSLFPRNIFDGKRQVVFIKNKHYKNIIYVCCFYLNDLKDYLNELESGKMMTIRHYKNTMFMIYNSILCFKVFTDLSIIEHYTSTHDIFNSSEGYYIYNPSKDEIDKIKILYRTFVKKANEEIKRNKIEKIKDKMKYKHKSIIDTIKKSWMLYKDIEKYKDVDTIIQKTSQNYIDYFESCKIKSHINSLKYFNKIENIEFDDEMYIIKNHIISKIYNNKPFSITCVDVKGYREIYIVIEKEYRNTWYIYFNLSYKNNKCFPFEKEIIINKKYKNNIEEIIDKEIVEPTKIIMQNDKDKIEA